MPDDKIAVYDPSKLMDTVKDRIRSEFAALIPDDAWRSLVDKAVKSFFEPRIERQSYGPDRTIPSEFDQCVHSELRKQVDMKLIEYFSRPGWDAAWSTNGEKATSEAIKKIVADNLNLFVQAEMEAKVKLVIESVRRHMGLM